MSSANFGKTAAIIAEYNPFHNAHAYHISKTKELTCAENTVVIMSGNFVQRGDCAICDKFTRTRMALAGGADLVLELPLPFACATAEKFAAGGVGIADALGCVDYLSFGTECGDVGQLSAAADAVSDDSIKPALDRFLAQGNTFAAARTEAVREVYGDDIAGLLCLPNNTLAVEYIRAIRRINSRMEPIGIRREGAYHDSAVTSDSFASATAVRRMLFDGAWDNAAKFMPDYSWSAFHKAMEQGTAPADIYRCDRAILSRIRGMTREQLANLPDVSEGLENRIFESARSAASLDALYSGIKSKRYSHARVRRVVLSAFLGIRAVHSMRLPYIRILGMNSRGRALLSASKPKLPIISSYRHIHSLPLEAQNAYRLECYADDMWALMTPSIQPCGADMTSKLIVF